ncbi:TPA: hypothetical protein NV714_004751 [Escherichia coli]|nr:hypothetical protein [Escherichia coli]
MASYYTMYLLSGDTKTYYKTGSQTNEYIFNNNQTVNTINTATSFSNFYNTVKNAAELTIIKNLFYTNNLDSYYESLSKDILYDYKET